MKAKALKRFKKDVDLPRLGEAITAAREALRVYRDNRREMVKQAAGSYYSEDAALIEVPVNMIASYERIVGRRLISQNPRVMLSTHDQQQRPVVAAMETWVNQELDRMKFAAQLQRIVVDALYSVGMAKICLADPGTAANKSWRLSAGQPVIERVDLDDFVFDVYASTFDDVGYMGHRYSCLKEVALKLYADADAADYETTEYQDYNKQGDERISVIGRGVGRTRAQFEDRVDLWEIFLPRHQLVVTLLDNELTGGEAMKPLRVQKWIGPPEGPYLPLGFEWVAGNPMPKGPIQNLYPMHLAGNRTYRKLIREADRFKSVLPYAAGAAEEVGRLKQAADGEMFQADHPESLKEVPLGGPNQGLFLWAQHVVESFNEQGGNLALLGGTAPQSRTAEQDKLLNSNSSVTISDMQDITVTFVSEAIRRLGWYWWNHPQAQMASQYKVPGVDHVAITRTVLPAGEVGPGKNLRRNGPMPDMRIDPYSLQFQTPQQRLSFLNGLVTLITPMMPVLQQQGVQFDINAFLQLQAKYSDEPDVAQIFKSAAPPAAGDAADPAADMPGLQTGGGPGGEKNYTRRSVGDGSTQAKKADLTAQLMGAKSAGAAGLGTTLQGPMGGPRQ